jgi:hypothetical protein
VYISTGNGLFGAEKWGGRNYGDTLLKLRLQQNRLVVTDFFTPLINQNSIQAMGLRFWRPTASPGQVGHGHHGLSFLWQRRCSL